MRGQDHAVCASSHNRRPERSMIMVQDSMDAEQLLWSRRLGLGVDTTRWPLPLVGAEINHVSPSSAHATESPTSNISPRCLCMPHAGQETTASHPCSSALTLDIRDDFQKLSLPPLLTPITAMLPAQARQRRRAALVQTGRPAWQHVLGICYREINIATSYGFAEHAITESRKAKALETK
jgi:hypothetical protein